jgi:hypothetical protein
MSQIRLYIDEDSMKQSLVVALRTANIDVITASDANRNAYSDERQLAWATEKSRVLYSANIKDFCRLHRNMMAEGDNHAGIVLIQQQRYSVGEVLRSIQNLLTDKSAEEMLNQLVFLSKYLQCD